MTLTQHRQVPADSKPDIIVVIVGMVVVAIGHAAIVVIVDPRAPTNHWVYETGSALFVEDKQKSAFLVGMIDQIGYVQANYLPLVPTFSDLPEKQAAF